MTSPSEREATVRADLESLRIDRGGEVMVRRGRRRRGAYVVAAILIVVAAGLARTVMRRAPAVTVVNAERAPAGESTAVPVLSGSGYVVTGDRYISIGVRVPGRIDQYFVEEGQSVHKGDPLVQLDDRDYRAQVDRIEAGLRLARANESLADAELRRGRELHAKAVTSQAELDVLQNKADVARATIRQIEAELQQAKVNLDYTTLRAPTDGVVLAKLKEVGEIAVPGGFAGSGDLIRIANLTDMRAEVDVNEADLGRVRMRQPAEVTPDAHPDRHYAAEVVKMYPQVDRQKGTLKVEVGILEPDATLLPDMSVRIAFLEPLPPEKARQPPVLVPAGALRRDGTDRRFVWTVTDGTVRRTLIETAGQIGDRVRVISGLSGGEAVVVSADQGLSDGAAVRVVP